MSRFAPLPALFLLMSPALAGAQAVEFASQREGVDLRAADSLPVNPDTGPVDCGALGRPLESPGAQAAAAANWIVTSEIPQNDLTFVSFVARATPGTSGSCLLQGGRVGIFLGPDLLGLVEAAPAAARNPGYLQPLDGGGVRIWDGDYGAMPLADLHVIADELVLARPPADRDRFCTGDVDVPSLYGLPIHQARILLLAEGWQPLPAEDPAARPHPGDMALPELQDCQGTGFGYCGYSYRQDSGDTLSVITAGEGSEGSSAMVVDFNVTCG